MNQPIVKLLGAALLMVATAFLPTNPAQSSTCCTNCQNRLNSCYASCDASYTSCARGCPGCPF
jgi:hypothetical protein